MPRRVLRRDILLGAAAGDLPLVEWKTSIKEDVKSDIADGKLFKSQRADLRALHEEAAGLDGFEKNVAKTCIQVQTKALQKQAQQPAWQVRQRRQAQAPTLLVVPAGVPAQQASMAVQGSRAGPG